MDVSTITVAQFKARFYRDFQFYNQVPNQENAPLPPYDLIQDLDIQNAFSDALALFNPGLFCDDATQTNAFLLLTAFCLVQNIKNSDGGTDSSAGSFPVSSRSVGSVSEAYMIPDAYKDSPVLASYTANGYGMKYLQLVLPQLIGNVVAVAGGALAAR